MSPKEFMETLPAHDLGGYGGNTTCAEVKTANSRLLIDAGSGLRNFSEFVMKTEFATPEYHFYMTHFHWDHLLAIPFFAPLYIKGKKVHFYSVEDMEPTLRALFKKPNFPVPFEVVEPQVQLHRVEPRKPFQVGDFTITPYRLDHPDPCWGARIEADGKVLAWSVDNEFTRMSAEELGEDVTLYRDADMLVFDAQYTFGEAMEKINWGHASGPLGLDLSIRENVKRTVFIHHDPSATDQAVREAEEQTQHYYEEITKRLHRSGQPVPSLVWHFGKEGEEFNVGEAT